jgi:hypothetical protein
MQFFRESLSWPVAFSPSAPSSFFSSLLRLAGAKAQEAVRELAPQHFDPEEMFDNIVARAAGAPDAAEIATLTEFYRDGLGKRATELEKAAQQPGREAESEAEGLKILQGLIDAKDPRLNHYVQIVDALGAIDNAIALGLNVTYAIISVMVGSPTLPQALSDEQILAIVKSQEDGLRSRAADRIYTSVAYTYRDMSDADLAAYAAFFEREEARKFYRVINQASSEEMAARARAFGHAMMVRMGVRKA